MKPLPLIIALISLGFVGESVQAQVRGFRNPGRVAVPVGVGFGVGPFGAGFYPYGYNLGGGYSPVEGYQRGMADVIRARGQAAEDYARARLSAEQARSQYIKNQKEWTDVYWERKRRAEAELAKDYAEDRKRRDKWLKAKRGRKPETLPPSQYDPQSGNLQWPDALQEPVYAELRRQIEDELDLQAETGTTSNTPKIRELADEMKSLLKNRIDQMSPNEYIASRKFLERLENQVVLASRS